jgi:CDP-4-dehydro-6-deoxyglucose reductase
MYKIKLANNSTFFCALNNTIFQSAQENGINLEHSCLSARCRSCAVQLISGKIKDKIDDLILSEKEKSEGWILTCNSIPLTDLVLDTEGLGQIRIFDKKIIPAKIHEIERINSNVVKVILRLPPNSNFEYYSGQYVNISRGELKRSYSIMNTYAESGLLTFLIKKYDGGSMSLYWFEQAKVNDLLRIEGPIGSFYYKESTRENLILVATGTGIAPINSILEGLSKNNSNSSNKKIWVVFGVRTEDDLVWNADEFNSLLNINFIPVLSRPTNNWTGKTGYVQDIILELGLSLEDTDVYACGSDLMIQDLQKKLYENGLSKKQFYSDAFVATN